MNKISGPPNFVGNQGFCDVLKVASLVFLDIAQDCSLGQCLTSSRAETSKIFFEAQIVVEMIFSILMSWSIHSDLLVKFCSVLFSCNIIRVNHFIFFSTYSNNSVLDTFPVPVLYEYDAIPSKFCNLLLWLLLTAILLIFYENTMRASLLNLCCETFQHNFLDSFFNLPT